VVFEKMDDSPQIIIVNPPDPETIQYTSQRPEGLTGAIRENRQPVPALIA